MDNINNILEKELENAYQAGVQMGKLKARVEVRIWISEIVEKGLTTGGIDVVESLKEKLNDKINK